MPTGVVLIVINLTQISTLQLQSVLLKLRILLRNRVTFEPK